MWKFLHIACMAGAVAVLAGGGVFRNAVLRTGSVASIRQVLAAERRPSAELVALIGSPRTRVLNLVDVALWVALIYVMVVKPFS